jgi:small conductance mechanosensitive channel
MFYCQFFKGNLFRAFVICFFAIFLSKLVKKSVEKILKKRIGENKRADTLLLIFARLVSYVIYFLACTELLQMFFNIQPTAILAAASVAGVSFGLGFQDIIKDAVCGFFIILENQYAVNEKITIDDFTGIVTEIGIRSTKVKSDVGDVLIIPNGSIKKIINHSRDSQGIYVYVTVPYEQNVDEAIDILKLVAAEAEKNIFGIVGRPQILGTSRVGMLGTKIDFFANTKTSTECQNQRDLIKLIKDELDKHNVKAIIE